MVSEATTNPLKDNASVSVYIITYVRVRVCVYECVCVFEKLVLAQAKQHFQ